MDGNTWCCPGCRGLLRPGRDEWSCRSCGTCFRALRGIPDLRTGEDLYLSNEDDWSFALRLDHAYDRLDFRGLLDAYLSLDPDVASDQKRRQVAHILSAPGRAGAWLEAVGRPAGGRLLDLGCGSGSLLAVAGRRAPEVCGVDIALRWLLVARKRLDEEGLRNVPLACACAEDLPLADNSVARVLAGDVIEHVGDQRATLAEAYRVLEPGGRVFLATPNRFSLGPEPHVHVWGVGYLPRRWMASYVRAVRGSDFRAIRTHGIRGWVRMLSVSPFDDWRITAPVLPTTDLAHFGPVKRTAARMYNAVATTRTGRWAALAVGPLFHIVAEKPPRTPPPRHPHNPSTRRPTTQQARQA